jgi:hypothetical protein
MIKEIIKNILPNAVLQWRKKRQKIKVMKDFNENPQILATRQYAKVFNEKPNLDYPKNLIEKIIWLQFNSDTSMWTRCADKYRVRGFVEEKGLGKYLCDLYGVWTDSMDIDFESLPNQFVLKVNNSCGQIIIVKDKTKLDIEATRRKLNRWMKEGYGYDNAQMHYTRISPCIIAEEMLPSLEGYSLVDYKIWCFSGVPECVLVCYNRNITGRGYSLSMYDTKWNNISESALNRNSKHFSGNDVPKPDHFDRMLEIAAQLSSGFPEVRVDLYNINGRIVFGELTFTTGYGSYNKEFYSYLGSLVSTKKS